MIAYNKIWLDNLAAREEIEQAFHADLMNAQEKKTAEASLPVGFYSPNFFIRVGLFLLTIIIACFSLGLLFLIFLSGMGERFSVLFIFFGLLSYVALEFFVRTKHHYRSGVDDALLWTAGICILSGINFDYSVSAATNSLVIFLLATYFSIRFADMFMSAIAAVALLAVVFFNYIQVGNIGKATAPFLLMLVAAAIYFLFKKIREQGIAKHYRQCLIVLEIVTLICFYAVSNYYLVQETGREMFGAGLNDSGGMPFGWLFWIFTVCLPFAYILWGIRNKEAVLIRVGLLLTAAIVFTVRYYYSVLPVEQLLLLGGIVLAAVSYALTKYLAQPKKGFTSAELDKSVTKQSVNLEALIIAETFAGTGTENNTKFGGGNFGGGGASGDF